MTRTTASDKRIAFRQMHESGFFLLPNAWDAGSAVRLTQAGFRAIASTSAGG
jgi:2-methylisocitrate lyase-like PEP mutase family enzyme